LLRAFSRYASAGDALSTGISSWRIADPFWICGNSPVTGGAPLWPIPALFNENSIHCHIGDFPDLRLVRMQGFEPQDTFLQGTDTWQVFPFKRKSTYDATNLGTSPAPPANTWDWGYAIKVIS
jgi:hypothetical protein